MNPANLPLDATSADSLAEKHQHILDAATAVFLERGYGETSMERVAKASGAARRTLYNQFKSKEALFEAMIVRIWSRVPVFEITRDAASLNDPRLGLMRLGQAVAEFWLRPETVALLRMVIAEGPRSPALTKIYLDLGKGPALAAVVAYLAALAERKLVSIAAPELAARQFLGLINEALLWPRVLGLADPYSAPERQRIVLSAVELFLSFYQCQPPSTPEQN